MTIQAVTIIVGAILVFAFGCREACRLEQTKHCTVVKITYPDGQTKEWHNARARQWEFKGVPITFKHGRSNIFVLHGGGIVTIYETPFLEHAEKVEPPKEEP